MCVQPLCMECLLSVCEAEPVTYSFNMAVESDSTVKHDNTKIITVLLSTVLLTACRIGRHIQMDG